MSACTHAMVEGINAALVKAGEVAWPDAKTASEVCYEVSEALNGPDILPESGLSPKSAQLIIGLLKSAHAEMVKEGACTPAQAKAFRDKTAADVSDLDKLAEDVAGECMLKAAAETMLLEPGQTGPNDGAAAAQHDTVAKLDQHNRSDGEYNVGVGNSTFQEGGEVGEERKPDKAPDLNASPNSLEAKMSALRDIVDSVKTAKSKGSKTLDTLRGVLRGAKDAKAPAKAKAKSWVGHAAAGGAGAVAGGAAGFAAGRKSSEKDAAAKTKAVKGVVERTMSWAKKNPGSAMGAAGAIGAVGGAGAGVAGTKAKLAKLQAAGVTNDQIVMRGVMKAAALMALPEGMKQLKIAALDGIDPEQLRALADYIEQNVQQDSNQVDLSQLDPHLLQMLHQQGAGDMGEEMEGQHPEPDGDEPHGGGQGFPPKRASFLERVKQAAGAEAGLTNSGGPNTGANAAKHDSVGALDQKNRPDGEYEIAQGHGTGPTGGTVGKEVVKDETPENPANKLKAAAFSDEERTYIEAVEKVALLYGDKLPASMDRAEKTAAYRHLVSLTPADRAAYIKKLQG